MGKLFILLVGSSHLFAGALRSVYIGYDGKEHSNRRVADDHKPDYHLRKPRIHMLNHFVGGDSETSMAVTHHTHARAPLEWDAVKLFRAEQCVFMIKKHKEEFDTNFQPCVEFMENTCVPGDDGEMDGSAGENPSGKGYCKAWIAALKNLGGEEEVEEELHGNGCADQSGMANCTTMGCNWNGTGCEDPCDAMFDEASCGDQDQCAWQSTNCIVRCDFFANNSACMQHHSCFWKDDTCQTACSTFIDDDACSSQSHCSWDGFACRVGCHTLKDEAGCSVLPTCTWDGGTCQNSCALHLNQDSCKDNPDCKWKGTVCIASCLSFNAHEECEENQECDWSDDGTCDDTAFAPVPVQGFHSEDAHNGGSSEHGSYGPPVPEQGENSHGELQEQGFQGKMVKHDNWYSHTADFGHEYGPTGAGLQTYRDVCCKHLENKWCRMSGYHNLCPKPRLAPVRSSANSEKRSFSHGGVIAIMPYLAGVLALLCLACSRPQVI